MDPFLPSQIQKTSLKRTQQRLQGISFDKLRVQVERIHDETSSAAATSSAKQADSKW